MDRDEKIKDFHKKVLLLSRNRTQQEAYNILERKEKHETGVRVYKNYNSYRACISWRRKNEKI